MFGFFEKKKADVLCHWYALVPSFNTSTKEFYEAIEKELKDRQVPGLEMFHVDFAEGGVLSAKREYLRMTRERLVFDICAAPFGTAYFFSCRFAEIPAVIQLWQVIVLLLTFGICIPLSFVICVKIFGMLAPFVWPVGWIAFIILTIYVMRNAVALGLKDLDATLIKSPVLDISKEAFEQFLSNLSLCREPIAFELVGTHNKVAAQFVAGQSDSPLLRRQLQAYFPEAVFVPHEGNLVEAWDGSQGDEILAVEFGLKHEFMLPLASGRLDPFIGIVGALSELQPGELGLFQVLFQPVQHPWAENIVNFGMNS